MYNKDKLSTFLAKKWSLKDPLLLTFLGLNSLVGPTTVIYLNNQSEVFPATFLISLSILGASISVYHFVQKINKRRDLKSMVVLIEKNDKPIDLSHFASLFQSLSRQEVQDLIKELRDQEVIGSRPSPLQSGKNLNC